jgi:hypothetical protein
MVPTMVGPTGKVALEILSPGPKVALLPPDIDSIGWTYGQLRLSFLWEI